MRYLMIFLILINSAFAQNSVTMKKGDIASFDGHLVKKDRLEELVKAEKSNIVLRDLGLAKDELIEYHKVDARTQRGKLSQAKFESYMTNVGSFVLGVVLASFAFKISGKVGDI